MLAIIIARAKEDGQVKGVALHCDRPGFKMLSKRN